MIFPGHLIAHRHIQFPEREPTQIPPGLPGRVTSTAHHRGRRCSDICEIWRVPFFDNGSIEKDERLHVRLRLKGANLWTSNASHLGLDHLRLFFTPSSLFTPSAPVRLIRVQYTRRPHSPVLSPPPETAHPSLFDFPRWSPCPMDDYTLGQISKSLLDHLSQHFLYQFHRSSRARRGA